MLELQFKDAHEFEEFFFGPNAPKGEIYMNMYEGIRSGFLNDLDVVTFAEIYFEDGTMMVLDSERSEWDLNLKNCINHFIKEEEYELCSKIDKLKKQLNDA